MVLCIQARSDRFYELYTILCLLECSMPPPSTLPCYRVLYDFILEQIISLIEVNFMYCDVCNNTFHRD